MADQKKRPIDIKRDAAFSVTISNVDNTGVITGMVPVGDTMLIVKEKAIYKILLADQIDPDRKNIDVNHTQQKFVAYGSSDDVVSKTLLTAKKLFLPTILPADFDTSVAMKLTLDGMENLCSLIDAVTEIKADQKKIVETHTSKKLGASIAIPSLGNVQARAKSLIQRSDHFCADLLKLTRLFYGNSVGKRWFESFSQFVESKYGGDDEFTNYFREVLNLLRFVRYMRDAAEHPTDDAYTIFKDFELKADGTIFLPSIEVIHPETPQSQISITELFAYLGNRLPFVFEGMVALMCQKNIRPFAGLDLAVGLLSEDQQKSMHVRYSYFANLGGSWVPFG